jgi:hypothetical protein
MLLPMPVAQFAMPAGRTRFNYRVLSSSRFSGLVETTPWLTYDLANPGLAFAGGLAGMPMFPDLNNTSIAVTQNAAAYAANGSQGVLLLHHLNEFGHRAEVLSVVQGS